MCSFSTWESGRAVLRGLGWGLAVAGLSGEDPMVATPSAKPLPHGPACAFHILLGRLLMFNSPEFSPSSGSWKIENNKKKKVDYWGHCWGDEEQDLF